MSSELARPDRLRLEPFAHATGLHPQLARRLVALGLLEARSDDTGELWFARDQVRQAARIQRLRAGLACNYAALALVMDLLDRIAVLEATLRQRPRPSRR